MTLLRWSHIADVFKASILWLGLGLSLAWYYAFALAGGRAWPMPLPETSGALILYHFSPTNAGTWLETLHWLLAFPAAGIVWVTFLTITVPFFGGTRTEYAWTLVRFALTSLPVIAPAPVLAYLAGRTPLGFSWSVMVDVVLGRAAVAPSIWPTPLYVVLATVALVWQVTLYVKVFDMHGKKAVLHLAVSAVLLVFLVSGVATLGMWALDLCRNVF